MKTAYTILTLILLGSAYLLKDTDHGSEKAFSDSLRAAGHFTQLANK
jgi:hypothetical protein